MYFVLPGYTVYSMWTLRENVFWFFFSTAPLVSNGGGEITSCSTTRSLQGLTCCMFHRDLTRVSMIPSSERPSDKCKLNHVHSMCSPSIGGISNNRNRQLCVAEFGFVQFLWHILYCGIITDIIKETYIILQ